MSFKIILHIPHSSLRLPKKFYTGCLLTKSDLKHYLHTTADIDVDKLFNMRGIIKIKPKYSRLFCDVERFADDKLEVMSKYGQGVIYTHNYDKSALHTHDKHYRQVVLKYYYKYHNRIDNLFKKIIEDSQPILILDCHSFSETMADFFFKGPYPDICIGIESKYYDEKILNHLIQGFEKYNYCCKINHPYRGSFVPNYIYNSDKKINNVISIMIEINKKIYDDKLKFKKLKMVLKEIISTI